MITIAGAAGGGREAVLLSVAFFFSAKERFMSACSLWLRRLVPALLLPALLIPLAALPPRVGAQAVPRDRAPELDGVEWLNTDKPLHLKDLRGKIVVLDF